MEIRLAILNDLDDAMQCIEDSRTLLKSLGLKQWNAEDGYPTIDVLKSDILSDSLFVAVEDSSILGCIALLSYESEYDKPYGKWLQDTEEYTTIHRLAVKERYRGCGVAKKLIIFATDYALKHSMKSIRIDTHEGNYIMQSLVTRLGFTNCGYVIYQSIMDEPKRLIYEKLI